MKILRNLYFSVTVKLRKAEVTDIKTHNEKSNKSLNGDDGEKFLMHSGELITKFVERIAKHYGLEDFLPQISIYCKKNAPWETETEIVDFVQRCFKTIAKNVNINDR